MNRGVWWATVHGLAKLDLIEQSCMHNTFTNIEEIKPTYSMTLLEVYGIDFIQ